MEELSPNNYKKVIKKANEIRNNNIKEKLKEGGSVSGLYYFRDKIEKFLDNFFKKPENTESYNKECLEKFFTNDNNIQKKNKKKIRKKGENDGKTKY